MRRSERGEHKAINQGASAEQQVIIA